MTVEELATLLQPFIDGTSPYCRSSRWECINYATPTDDGGCRHTDAPEITAIEAWTEVLDASSRGVDPAKHQLLKDLTGGQCYARPGERDSFGWVTGLLQTPHGYFIE